MPLRAFIFMRLYAFILRLFARSFRAPLPSHFMPLYAFIFMPLRSLISCLFTLAFHASLPYLFLLNFLLYYPLIFFLRFQINSQWAGRASLNDRFCVSLNDHFHASLRTHF